MAQQRLTIALTLVATYAFGCGDSTSDRVDASIATDAGDVDAGTRDSGVLTCAGSGACELDFVGEWSLELSCFARMEEGLRAQCSDIRFEVLDQAPEGSLVVAADGTYSWASTVTYSGTIERPASCVPSIDCADLESAFADFLETARCMPGETNGGCRCEFTDRVQEQVTGALMDGRRFSLAQGQFEGCRDSDQLRVMGDENASGPDYVFRRSTP